jgi:hypothetical protein
MLAEKLWRVLSATLAAIMAAVAGTLTLMLKGGHVVVFGNPAATLMAAGSVADSGIDKDNDPTAPAISEAAASSMLEKGKCNKSGTKDIDIQAFYVILQLGVGYCLIA